MEDLIYKIFNKPNEAIHKLLLETVYGTKGVKIRHKDTGKKLSQLIDPEFHTLYKGKELLGVAVYCKRNIELKGSLVDAYYIRYFSIRQEYQNSGLGKELTKRIESHYREVISKKTVFYAYIEERNLKSVGVTKHFSSKVIGTMRILFVSRFFPKKHKNCKRTSSEELSRALVKLKGSYKGYSTLSLNRVGYENEYYIYKEGEEIIAGVQLINTKWEVQSIPGFFGSLSLGVFPYVPVLKKIADGQNMSFAAIEGVYCKEGELDKLMLLIEHSLAESQNSKAFLYFDEKAPLYTKLKGRGDLGLLNRIQQAPGVRIIEQSLFLEEEDELFLKDSLKYISAFDVT